MAKANRNMVGHGKLQTPEVGVSKARKPQTLVVWTGPRLPNLALPPSAPSVLYNMNNMKAYLRSRSIQQAQQQQLLGISACWGVVTRLEA